MSATTPKETRAARLEARIPLRVQAMLKRAVRLRGGSISEFVVRAVEEAATRAIDEERAIKLAREEQKQFVEALLKPARPNAALRKAAAAHHKLISIK